MSLLRTNGVTVYTRENEMRLFNLFLHLNWFMRKRHCVDTDNNFAGRCVPSASVMFAAPYPG